MLSQVKDLREGSQVKNPEVPEGKKEEAYPGVNTLGQWSPVGGP